jgi:hypothetical protein
MSIPIRALCSTLAGLIAFAPMSASSAETVEADLIVYGGTSGGVVAAVQAARMGKKAVIVEPGKHLGGMTAGGLSWTDVGSSSDRVRAIGGMAREVYERIGAHYGQKPGTAFDVPSAKEQRGKGVDFAKPPSLAFEPKVAEAVFVALAKEHGVSVYFERQLANVRKEGARLHEFGCEDGSRFRGRMYLDATYEGDLLAKAGVSYTVGREANSQYDETLNGVQLPARSPNSGKFEVRIDPYVVPGDPSSGILPYLLRNEPLGESGAADQRVQSYNYRVCLTDEASNRLPLAPPDNYEAANYELLARWIEARLAAGQKLTLRSFLKYDPLQNRKFDFNNRWPISTDYIGGAWEYPDATPERRREIAREHERYLRGLFHFLGTSPRVPAEVREEMGRFGLCRDEFVDHGGWPHQLYVREARRMVSDFVMTEHHVRGAHLAERSIGLGTYGIDMHAVRRIVHEGQPINEGSNGGSVPRPYPIDYGAIVPQRAECDNLLVTFALSASHVAFGSIRMEPVFMTLSQSAATAACLAIDKDQPVQDVSYPALRARLLADQQVLTWIDGAAPPLPKAAAAPAP